MSIRILRIRDVCAMTGLSRSYVYQLTGADLFPKPILLVPGGKAKGWLESEVQDWLHERVNERESA